MKRKRVLVACNTLTAIDSEAAMDQKNLCFRLGRDFRNMDFLQMDARRMSIDRFRNFAFDTALRAECDYILFVDDDMRFQDPRTIFGQLLWACKKYDIVAALNYIRGYPFNVMSFIWDPADNGERKRLIPVPDKMVEAAQGGVIPVDAIGTAVCLIKMKNIRLKVPAPWFVTGPHSTEDIYFCMRCLEYCPKIKIGLHTGAYTGHLLDREVISYYTKKHLMAYYESFMSPEDIKNAKEGWNGDRGQSYVDENVQEADS